MDTPDVHLLRPSDVVDLLGVSRSWLYDAAKAGRIPCVRLGGPDGPVRFRARELEAWIERGRVASPAPERLDHEKATPASDGTPTGRDDGRQLRLLSEFLS